VSTTHAGIIASEANFPSRRSVLSVPCQCHCTGVKSEPNLGARDSEDIRITTNRPASIFCIVNVLMYAGTLMSSCYAFICK